MKTCRACVFIVEREFIDLKPLLARQGHEQRAKVKRGTRWVTAHPDCDRDGIMERLEGEENDEHSLDDLKSLIKMLLFYLTIRRIGLPNSGIWEFSIFSRLWASCTFH